MTFIYYIYLLLLSFVKKIFSDFHLLIDRNNNLYYYYYDYDANYLDQFIFQNYNIHDYDSDIGYDLEIENDIVSIEFNSS